MEAAAEAARKAMIKPGCCMEGTGCELPPCHCSRVAVIAALAAYHAALGETARVTRVQRCLNTETGEG